MYILGFYVFLYVNVAMYKFEHKTLNIVLYFDFSDLLRIPTYSELYTFVNDKIIKKNISLYYLAPGTCSSYYRQIKVLSMLTENYVFESNLVHLTCDKSTRPAMKT